MNKEPRLHFTDTERSNPELERSICKMEKAADKADKAQQKIPKNAVKVKERTVDPVTGKISVHLHFEEMDKKPPSKLNHTVSNLSEHFIIRNIHREIHNSEEENVGVESAHKSEETMEAGGKLLREGYHSHKLKPYRKAAQAEHKLEKANINALYQKSLQDNPQFTSNFFSRWQQKQRIKAQYAAAKRSGQAAETAKSVAKSTEKAAEHTKRAAQFVWHHRKGIGIAALIAAALCMILGTFSSCSMMAQSLGSMVVGSTYPSEDAQMLAAEEAYSAMEAHLQSELDNYEVLHPGADAYVFELDDIGHDPYVLISLVSAHCGGAWDLEDVQDFLDLLFSKQYILTIEEERVPGTKTELIPDANGNLHPVTVPDEHLTVKVTLENFDLSHLPLYVLTREQAAQYALYMASLGNRPDLFPQSEFPNASVKTDYEDYDIPPEALEDETFSAMITEAEKYLGYPYVWGGSNPDTSFDCSGFVSWVINHAGWNVGRRSAQGLLDLCTRVSGTNARPGDLIFFQKTYDTAGASHVGIYVGNNKMIHCGNPISYTSTNSAYWQEHFLAFGRLP